MTPVRISKVDILPVCDSVEQTLEGLKAPWATFRVLSAPSTAPIHDLTASFFQDLVRDRLPRRRSLDIQVLACARDGSAAVVVSAKKLEILAELMPKLDAPFLPEFRESLRDAYTLPADVAAANDEAMSVARDMATTLIRDNPKDDVDLLVARFGFDSPVFGRGEPQEDVRIDALPIELQPLGTMSHAPDTFVGPIEIRIVEGSRVLAFSVVRFLEQGGEDTSFDELVIPVRGPVWGGERIGFDPSWVEGVEMVPSSVRDDSVTATLRLTPRGLSALQAAHAAAKARLDNGAYVTIVLMLDPSSASSIGSLANDGRRLDIDALQAATPAAPLVALRTSYVVGPDTMPTSVYIEGYEAALSGLRLERVASSKN